MTCSECKYTQGQEGGSLTCQRFPQPARVARSYWCGEYQPAGKPKEQPQERAKKGLRATTDGGDKF